MSGRVEGGAGGGGGRTGLVGRDPELNLDL